MSEGRLFAGFTPIQGRATATGTSDTLLYTIPNASTTIYVSKVSISNNHASQNTEVHLKSGTDIIWTFSVPFAGGNEPTFPYPSVIKCAKGASLYFASTVATTTITVSFAGFITTNYN